MTFMELASDTAVIFIVIFSIVSAHIGLKTKDNRNNIDKISEWISHYSENSILHRTTRLIARILNKITPRPDISTAVFILSLVIVYIITELTIFGVPEGATNSQLKAMLVFAALMLGFSYTFGNLFSQIGNYCRGIQNDLRMDPEYNKIQIGLLVVGWVIILLVSYSTFGNIHSAVVVIIISIILLFIEFILHLNS